MRKAGIPVNFWLPRLHHAVPTEFEQFYFDPESLELFKDIPQSSAVSELVPFLSFRGDVKAHVREHTQELVKLLQAAHADLVSSFVLFECAYLLETNAPFTGSFF